MAQISIPVQNSELANHSPHPEKLMNETTLLIDPTAPRLPEASSGPWQLAGVQGKVVGFIDNAKPNFNFLAEEIGALLTQEHGAARVVTHRKRSASLPVAEDALERIVAECDLVITGSGD